MEFDRIVQVRVVPPQSSGKAAFATGYLVAPRLVLTTAHVLPADPWAEGGTVSVCRPEISDQRFTVAVGWQRRDVTVDAALLEVAEHADWQTPESLSGFHARPPQRWGTLIGTRPHPVTVCGYPRMQKDVAGRLEEQLTGDVYPGTSRTTGRLEILSTHAMPATVLPAGARVTNWSGFSGAALLCGELLVGVVAQDRRAPAGVRLTATSVRDLISDSEFASVVTRHSAWPPVLEPVEPDHLLTPAACGRDLRSPAMLLRADTEAVTFHSRQQEQERLLAWCTSPDPFAVHLLTGRAGQGKSRLARHLAATLRGQGWIAAELRGDLDDASGTPGSGYEALETSMPMLLVVDYAETLPRQIRRIIEHLRRNRHRTRLLLLARSRGDWMTGALRAGADTRELLAAAPVLELSPLHGGAAASSRGTAFGRAVRDLSSLLGQIPALAGAADWLHVASKVRPPADLDHPRYGTALTLQIAALTSLLQRGPSPIRLHSHMNVESVMLAHEERYWEGTAASPAFQLGELRPALLRRVVAVAALYGAVTREEAFALTHHMPGLPLDRAPDVAEWLQTLYPPAPGFYWGSLQPDRLAEHHVESQLVDGRSDILAELWSRATDRQRLRAMIVLMRIARAHMLARRPAGATGVLKVLEDLLRTASPGLPVLRIAANLLPVRRLAPVSQDPFTPIGLCIDQLAVVFYREVAPADAGRYGPDYIDTLNNIAVRHHQLGRYREALEWFEEAVRVGRLFARTHAKVCEPRLAVALRNLLLLRPSRARSTPDNFLALAQEALAIERRFVANHPDTADASFLARALHDVGVELGRVGRTAEAVTALTESIDRYRRLAQTEPAYEHSLARVLMVLSIQLGDLGDATEYLALARESAEIRHRLGIPFSSDPQAGLRRSRARRRLNSQDP